jgi:hypothetical protein
VYIYIYIIIICLPDRLTDWLISCCTAKMFVSALVPVHLGRVPIGE